MRHVAREVRAQVAIRAKVDAAGGLGLEGMEEGLGVRVIARAAHIRALAEPQRDQAGTKSGAHARGRCERSHRESVVA